MHRVVEATMKTVTVSLVGVEGKGVSDAVACGKVVLATLDTVERVMIDTDGNDLDDAQWSEMEQYLARRGVAVKYNDELGYPVAYWCVGVR